MTMRAFILVLIFACAMTSIGFSQVAGSDAGTAKVVAALLQQQCSLRQSAKYDDYLATLAPNFQIVGPGIVKQSRDQIARAYTSGKKSDATLQKCDINVVFASKTSDGAYAQYTETDTYPDQTITVYDDAYFATAGSGLIARDVQRYSRNVYDGTKLIFGMGKQEFPSTGQLRATPAPPAMDETTVEALAGVTLSDCTAVDSTRGSWQTVNNTITGPQQQFVPGDPPGVKVRFVNNVDTPIARLLVAAVVNDETIGVIPSRGPFKKGHEVWMGGAFPQLRSAPFGLTCVILQVDRTDGTSWINPAPPRTPAQ